MDYWQWRWCSCFYWLASMLTIKTVAAPVVYVAGCSQYGFCGTTSDYCGQGCQSGPCSNLGGGSPSGGGGSVGTIISESVFNGLAGGAASSCEGKGFYTYNAFIAAASAYSGFGTTGSSDVQKRELAAFFANVMHETGGTYFVECSFYSTIIIYCIKF